MILQAEKLLKNGQIETGPIQLDSKLGYMTIDLTSGGESIVLEVEGEDAITC